MKSTRKRFADGGIIEGEGEPDPKRKLPADVVVKYKETTNTFTPIVDIEENDPIIYDKKDFDKYYRSKALNKLTPEDVTAYNDYARTDPANADAFLASRGGLPNYESYMRVVRDYEKGQITNPTDWSKIDSNIVPTTGGYRYNAVNGLFNSDRGKPALGSTTRRKKGGKMTLADIANCF